MNNLGGEYTIQWPTQHTPTHTQVVSQHMLAATTHPARHSSVHMHVPQRETPDNTQAALLRSLSPMRPGRNENKPPPARQRPARSLGGKHGTHVDAHDTHCTNIIYSRPHTHDAQSKQLARKVHLSERHQWSYGDLSEPQGLQRWERTR